MLLSVPMRHMKMHFLGTRYYLQGSVEFSFMLIIFNCSVRLRWFMNINLVQCICQSPLGIYTQKNGDESKTAWNMKSALQAKYLWSETCELQHLLDIGLPCSLKLFNIPLTHLCRWERTLAHWGCIAW